MQTVERAQERGCIDVATTEVGKAVSDSQLVIMATPLGQFRQLLEQLAEYDHDDLCITDVGSVKQAVCDAAQQVLPDPVRFVGAHPMAGSEQHGPEHASADLFRGRLCILTPNAADPLNSERALNRVRDCWTQLGMRLIEMSPQQHDRHMAAISHLPHGIAAVLVHVAQKRGAMGVASTGFRDVTRIASGDPTVWTDIFNANRAAVIESIDTLMDDMRDLRAVIADAQDDVLFDWLKEAKRMRDHWLATQGRAAHQDE